MCARLNNKETNFATEQDFRILTKLVYKNAGILEHCLLTVPIQGFQWN